MSKLLPESFDALVTAAVKQFWQSRSKSGPAKQGGGRDSVTAGKNMDGFADLIRAVTDHCGLPDSAVITTGRNDLTLPGRFRPTKQWDTIVIQDGVLIAAFEMKSQVGSFGNNFNNRSEESIGSATDFWTAHRDHAYDPDNHVDDALKGKIPIRPFLAYLMLIEASPGSTTSVDVAEEHFKVFPEFVGASYVQRYALLCNRLVVEGLYSAASLITSDKVNGAAKGAWSTPDKTIGPRALFAEFAGRLKALGEG
jgi:hypothetical protein